MGNVYGRCIIVVYCLGRPTGVHVGSSINLQTKQANANYSFLYGTCHFCCTWPEVAMVQIISTKTRHRYSKAFINTI